MLKKIIKHTAFVLTFFCLFATGIQASASSSLMTYSGTGIWDKRSVSNFTLSSTKTVTVHHTQTAVTYSGSSLTVSIRKVKTIGSSLQASKTFSGSTAGTLSASLSSGTYFLRFKSSTDGFTFNISGTVTA